MVNILLVISTLLLLSLAPQAINGWQPLTSQQYAQRFSRWILERNVSYSQDMLLARFDTFKSNLDLVETHNERFRIGLETFTMALNQNADLTNDEFRSRLGYIQPAEDDDNTALTLGSSNNNAANDIMEDIKNTIRDRLCQRFSWLCPPEEEDSALPSSTGVAPIVPSSSSTGRSASSSSAAPARSSTAAASSSARPSSSSSSAAARSSSSSPAARSSSSSTAPVVRPSSSSTASRSSSAAPAASSTGAPNPSATNLDWRDYGYIGKVKDQGSCGSCWTFASTSVMEASWALKTGNLLSFSEQELLDCAANGARTCATGGNMQDSWNWLVSGSTRRSPSSEATYPYSGQKGTCRWSASSATAATFTSKVSVTRTEAGLLAAVKARPAVAVAVSGSGRAFQFYASGVLSDSSCSPNSLDHAVTVVGYGTDAATGYDYWLIKNSWGTRWGENGYAKIRRNYNNMCGISSDPSYIVA